MDGIAVLFALVAGFCTAIEQTINGRLGREITPGLATLHNLLTGATVMLLANLVHGSLPKYAGIRAVNPALLIGGVFGAMIIYLSTKAIPVLGASTTLTLVIAGQLACGVITDLFLNNMTFQATKWVGIAVVALGIYLMMQ